MKQFSILIFICIAFVTSNGYSQTASNDLTGIGGISPELANYFERSYLGGAVVPKYVPTLAATPGASNYFKPMVNVIPTNAANNVGLLPATPVPGQRFIIINGSGASQRIKSGGTATMNGATAGGYIALPDKARSDCIASTTENYSCTLPVIPTPQ